MCCWSLEEKMVLMFLFFAAMAVIVWLVCEKEKQIDGLLCKVFRVITGK